MDRTKAINDVQKREKYTSRSYNPRRLWYKNINDKNSCDQHRTYKHGLQTSNIVIKGIVKMLDKRFGNLFGRHGSLVVDED
jgi:hypothetical protein